MSKTNTANIDKNYINLNVSQEKLDNIVEKITLLINETIKAKLPSIIRDELVEYKKKSLPINDEEKDINKQDNEIIESSKLNAKDINILEKEKAINKDLNKTPIKDSNSTITPIKIKSKIKLKDVQIPEKKIKTPNKISQIFYTAREKTNTKVENLTKKKRLRPKKTKYINEEETEFTVEAITDHRQRKIGKKLINEYKVVWEALDKNGKNETSWEPEDNLTHCNDLLYKFKKNIKNKKNIVKNYIYN